MKLSTFTGFGRLLVAVVVAVLVGVLLDLVGLDSLVAFAGGAAIAVVYAVIPVEREPDPFDHPPKSDRPTH